uniref:Uncharacterized protein n=1 Tax=Meloidogyne enterolobii TaxID=390850 RepID=A0A6V7V6U5_MELEN|nr:unnamed protein product [Meloidogyne enterolobii]
MPKSWNLYGLGILFWPRPFFLFHYQSNLICTDRFAFFLPRFHSIFFVACETLIKY